VRRAKVKCDQVGPEGSSRVQRATSVVDSGQSVMLKSVWMFDPIDDGRPVERCTYSATKRANPMTRAASALPSCFSTAMK
jgi:hypothetical protein